MTVPDDWLDERTTFEAVEEGLAEGWEDGLCPEEWFAFRRRAGPGDDLWEFCGDVPAESPDGDPFVTPTRWYRGYALVRGGWVVDAVLTAWGDAS